MHFQGRGLSLLEFPSPNDAKLGNKWPRSSEEEDENVRYYTDIDAI